MPRESKASKRDRAVAVAQTLERAYPESTCALRHDTPFQLLIATMLSAQTTDAKVNEATQVLFEKYPGPEELAAADEAEVGRIIGSIGLWRNKARNAVASARLIVETFDGELPKTVESLTLLPGVGRKTATAVLGTAFGIAAGITVDTHMLRINRLLDLSRAKDPEKMAADLEALLPPEGWAAYTHRIIDHGRVVCVARRPRCGVCPLGELCPSAGEPAAGYKPSNDQAVPASAANVSWLA